jgi:hypothetical protein
MMVVGVRYWRSFDLYQPSSYGALGKEQVG